MWLRTGSKSVRQTLKYHCLNSVPYFKDNFSSSVKLMGYYDTFIGPHTTVKSPHYYTVPSATDGCKVRRVFLFQ